MKKPEAIVKCWDLAKECILNKIPFSSGGSFSCDQPSFDISGFSKSGHGSLTIKNAGGEWEVVLLTRYNQVDYIDCFEDINDVAFYWYLDYRGRSPFENPDPNWAAIWVKQGRLKEKKVTTYEEAE